MLHPTPPTCRGGAYCTVLASGSSSPPTISVMHDSVSPSCGVPLISSVTIANFAVKGVRWLRVPKTPTPAFRPGGRGGGQGCYSLFMELVQSRSPQKTLPSRINAIRDFAWFVARLCCPLGPFEGHWGHCISAVCPAAQDVATNSVFVAFNFETSSL